MNNLCFKFTLGLALLPLISWAQGTIDNGDLASRNELDAKTLSGISRCASGCSPRDARELGMVPTGLQVGFNARLDCRNIDDGWAIDHTARRARDALHGGIDIPAPKGTPILAVADGEVVGLFSLQDSSLGNKLFLRHSPAETGKPFWVYTEYAHLEKLPDLQLGQHVQRGQVIGKTSNTGLLGQIPRSRYFMLESGKRTARVRRDALHFAVMYSDSPRYFVGDEHIIPVAGRWMDPIALFRSGPHYESSVLASVGQQFKTVVVPVAVGEPPAAFSLPDTLLIWPYACTRR